MKIHNKVVIDIETGEVVYEEAYDYYGPLVLCDGDDGDSGSDDSGYGMGDSEDDPIDSIGPDSDYSDISDYSDFEGGNYDGLDATYAEWSQYDETIQFEGGNWIDYSEGDDDINKDENTSGERKEDPRMYEEDKRSVTYSGEWPSLTKQVGLPVAKTYGRCLVAGNLVISSDDADKFYYAVIGHGLGRSETTKPKFSEVTHLAYFINNVEYSNMSGSSAHKIHSYSGTTYHTSGATNFFSSINPLTLRSIACSEIKIAKGDLGGQSVNNFCTVWRWTMCLQIGEDVGGVRTWTRNPAQILWDWYITIEKYTAIDLNEIQFQILYDYCDEIPTNAEAQPLRPPGPSHSTVTATSIWRDSEKIGSDSVFEPQYALDKGASLTDQWGGRQWISGTTEMVAGADNLGNTLHAGSTQQRINVDLGCAYEITKVVIENSHYEGGDTNTGVSRFKIQGSNNLNSFENRTYAGTGWTMITSGTSHNAAEHAGANINDPQTFELSSGTCYRYYGFKIQDGHGKGFDNLDELAITGIRDIKFYGKVSRYTFDYAFDVKSTINDAKKLIWSSFHGAVIQSQGQLKPVWDWRNTYGSGYNYALNGDFETNDPPDNWNADNGATLSQQADGKFGNCMQVACGAQNNPNGRQTVTVVPGEYYAFSVYVKAGTGTDYRLRLYDIDNANSIWDTAGQTATSVWTRYSHVFQVPVGCESVIIILYHAVAAGAGTNVKFDYCLLHKIHHFNIDNIVKDTFSWGKISRPNVVRIHYIDAHNYFKKEVVEIKDENDIDKKGEIVHEQEAWYITETDVAKRRCRFLFDKFRTTGFYCKFIGQHDSQDIELFDRTKVSHPLSGWSEKDFVVVGRSEDGTGRPSFYLEEYNTGVYHDLGFETQENFSSKLPNPNAAPSGVTNLSLIHDGFVDNNGNWIPKMNLTYNYPIDPFFSHSIISIATDGGDYESYGIDNSKGTGFIINGIKGKYVIGSKVTAQVISVNISGIQSRTSPTVFTTIPLPDIQAAVDSVSNGGNIILPEGTYTLTSAVTMPSKDLTITGVNRDVVKIQNSSGDCAFEMHNRTNFYTFNNLTFDSQSVTPNYSPMIYAHTEVGLDDRTSVLVDNCLFDLKHTLGDRTTGDRGFRGDKIKNLKIENSIFKKGRMGIFVRTGEYIIIANNTFFGQTYSGVSHFASNILLVDSNTCTQQYYIGMFIDNLSPIFLTKVSKNSITMAGSDHSYTSLFGIVGDCYNANFTENTINATYTANIPLYAIFTTTSSRYNNFTGNTIKVNCTSDQYVYGFYISSFIGDSLVANTLDIDNDDNTRSHYGIFITSDNCLIQDNTIDMQNGDPLDKGIYFDVGANQNQALNNKLTGCGYGKAITQALNAYENTIKGNTDNEGLWTRDEGELSRRVIY